MEHVKGRLVLADLAGSERVRQTHSQGIRLEEAKHINKSLSALGNVISALANPRKNGKQVIPYRSSKLTRILTNSLSVESKIVLLATCGPAKSSYHESVSTMQFAQRCQDIILKPQLNSELEIEEPNLVLQRLMHQIAEMEESHKHEVG